MQKISKRKIIIPLLLVLVIGLGFIVSRDYEPPTIEPESLTVNYGEVVAIDKLASVSDNREGDIKLRVDALACKDIAVEDDGEQITFNNVGKNKVRLYAADKAGNESFGDITVDVVDNEAPTFAETDYSIALEYNQPLKLSLEQVDDGNSIFIHANDKTKMNVSFVDDEADAAYSVSEDKKTVQFHAIGEFHLNFTVEDEFKNSSDGCVDISVVDQTKPEITAQKSEFTISENDKNAPDYMSGIQASDEIDGDLTNEVTVDDSAVQYGTPGSYPIAYMVSDLSGNVETIQKQVIIRDETPPVISLDTSSFSVTVGGEKPDYSKGISVSDNVDQNLSAQVKISDEEVNYASPGTYQVIYSVVDSAGNHAEREANVSVQSKSMPQKDNAASVDESGGGTVLITKTGECYHTHKCGNGTYFEATLEEAKRRGLRPCKKCYG